jgi:hypothetical protein
MGTVVLTGPVEGQYTNWQAPGFEASPQERLDWVEEQIQEGEGRLEGQPSYKNLAKNLRLYQGIYSDNSKSKLVTNSLKYNIRKLTSTLSEVREIALYGSDAVQFKPMANIENKVAKALYLEAQFPQQLKGALQYAAVMGDGYIWPKVEQSDYGYGERQIVFRPLGLLDVVATQVPSSGDIQDAYTVTIFDYMPIAMAHGKFPLFQAQLKPVTATDSKSRLQAKRLDFTEQVRYGDQGRTWGDLYCEIRYTFVRDLRINRTGQTIPMGDPGTSWYYEVPSVGSQILSGMQGMTSTYRVATPEDCRVYPQLRLIITAKGVDTPMYDGPAYDWHGKIPVVQYCVDKVPWMQGGESIVENVAPIEITKRKLERKIDQVVDTTLNPPMGYDMSAAGGPTIENFDLFREEGARLGLNGQPSQTFQSLLPDSVKVDAMHFNWLEYLGKALTDQLGISDLGNLANLKLNVNEEGMDKALESIGPIAKDIAAMMEAANAKIGYMLKFMIPQWFDTARIIQYIGPDNITQEVYDFDPGSLVPSHMPDEYVMKDGMWTAPDTDSKYQKIERAKRFAQNLRLVSVPSTLVKITQMQEQLKYLQLYRGGFPISPHTVAAKLDIDNFGDIKGTTEFEKWVNWKQMEVAIQVKSQLLAAQMMAAAGVMPPQPGEGGGGPQDKPASAPPQPSGPNQPHPGGRPPSGKKPPHLAEKGANSWEPRVTTEES